MLDWLDTAGDALMNMLELVKRVVAGMDIFCGFVCLNLRRPQPEYQVADPICTFLFSVLVVGTTLPVTKDVLRILMEGKTKQDTCFSFYDGRRCH